MPARPHADISERDRTMPEIAIGDRITTNLISGFGSVGCFLKPATEDTRLAGTYLLTNCHVIADEHYRVCLAGNTIVKAGTDEVARVYKAFREYNHKLGYLDWAVCKVSGGVAAKNQVNLGDGAVTVTKWADPKDDERLRKRGARTAVTTGTVTGIDHRAAIDYLPVYPATGAAAGKGLVTIRGRDFCIKGDSGSVAVNKDNRIVALLFASDGVTETLALPFRRILLSLQDKTKTTWSLA